MNTYFLILVGLLFAVLLTFGFLQSSEAGFMLLFGIIILLILAFIGGWAADKVVKFWIGPAISRLMNLFPDRGKHKE